MTSSESERVTAKRRAKPELRVQHRRYMNARGRALRRLGAAHLAELNVMLDTELAKLGYTGRVPHPGRVRSAEQ